MVPTDLPCLRDRVKQTELTRPTYPRPPDDSDPSYLNQLQTCLSRIPIGAYTYIGGDFNLGDIFWATESVKPCANKSGLYHQLLNIAKVYFLDQMVLEPTKTTEDTANILDLFFSNEQPLVNRVEVIYDHKAYMTTR